MNNQHLLKRSFLFAIPLFIFLLVFLKFPVSAQRVGKTEITKWQNDKKAAVSITYDDGNRNQFKIALPIMESMNLPATFFVITGPIKGSVYQPKFIGRPIKEIIAESKNLPTNADNFFERASASLYLGYAGTLPFYNLADEFYESGKKEKAWKVMDSLYDAVRNNELKHGKDTSMEMAQEVGLTWENLKNYAARGYETASHTVSHAHLAILDSANMEYELRKSKEEIKNHLGEKYTFSAEVPFGIEDPRVMKYGFPIYQALRNSMPEPWMQEINRGYKEQPGNSAREYVQWQRGPLSKTPISLMKSWIDTTLAHNNIWLVLVFHGIDDIGWEPTPHEKLKEYFKYIKERENNIWVAPFGNVARYLRERMDSKIESKNEKGKIIITITNSLNKNLYDEPLTLKTYLPGSWNNVSVKTQNAKQKIATQKDSNGVFVLYQAIPNSGAIEIVNH